VVGSVKLGRDLEVDEERLVLVVLGSVKLGREIGVDGG
jgi:hypothetical protein